MTTHLTHDDSVEEEPELVLIDDEEYEAAHRYDYADDPVEGEDEDEFEFSFEEELDEAIALDLSDQMDPTVEDADDRMAGLFSSQHEASTPGDAANETAPEALAAGASVSGDDGALLLGAGAAAPALSKQEAKAEERRQREILKRRKEMDKAALEDEKERQREEKVRAAAADREAAAAAVAAQKAAADAAKREAAEAKERAAEAKIQAAEDAKRAAADEKIRQAEEKAEAKRAAAEAKQQAAQAKTQAAEDKRQAAEDAKRAAAEAKIRQADEKTEAKRAAAEEKTRQAEQKAEAKRIQAEAKRTKSEKTRDGNPIPAGLTSFVEPGTEREPVAARTRKDARVEKREGTKRSLLVVVMVVLLVVVGAAAYVLTRPKAGVGTGTGAGTSAGTGTGGVASGGAGTGASALPAALASTVTASTADVAYSLAINGSQAASINGGGSVDLATQGSNLSLTYSQGGRSFPEQIVYDGGQGFYDLGAIVNYVTPGYSWVSTDLAPGSPPVPGIGVGGVLADPSGLVALLQASESSARDVGSVQVDGAPATEYSIALSQAELTHVLASAGLPSIVRSAPFTELNEQAYVDGTGRVSRIVAVGTYPVSGQSVTATTTLDLSHYGTPVSIAPPPSSQVVPEGQFEASAARLGGAPTP